MSRSDLGQPHAPLPDEAYEPLGALPRYRGLRLRLCAPAKVQRPLAHCQRAERPLQLLTTRLQTLGIAHQVLQAHPLLTALLQSATSPKVPSLQAQGLADQATLQSDPAVPVALALLVRQPAHGETHALGLSVQRGSRERKRYRTRIRAAAATLTPLIEAPEVRVAAWVLEEKRMWSGTRKSDCVTLRVALSHLDLAAATNSQRCMRQDRLELHLGSARPRFGVKLPPRPSQ